MGERMNVKKLFWLCMTIGFGAYLVIPIVLFWQMHQLTSMFEMEPMLAVVFESGDVTELIPVKYVPLMVVKPFIMGCFFMGALDEYLTIRKSEKDD
jgi:hypothetical protein